MRPRSRRGASRTSGCASSSPCLGGGAPPPKHGLLLAHPLVRDAPRRERGRMARRLAAKAAIAARVDCYGGEPCGAELLAALGSDDPVK